MSRGNCPGGDVRGECPGGKCLFPGDCRVVHGNGEAGNTAVTAVTGTKFTVPPRGWGPRSLYCCGDGESSCGNTTVIIIVHNLTKRRFLTAHLKK